MVHVVLLIACAVAIYLSCEWFVNAVEWLGQRLNIGTMAVGTILAAFGTALPESVVTLVAVTTGPTAEIRNIGVGAAMGGPLVLATVAYGVTGATLLLRRRRRSREMVLVGVGAASLVQRPISERDNAPDATLADRAHTARLVKDQRWFMAVFVVKVALGLVAFAIKPWLGLLFFAAYGVYFWREIRGGTSGDHDEHDLAPLKLQPRAVRPATTVVLVQTLGALAVIFVSSQIFVHQLDAIGPMLGLSSAVTALLLSPIATELPETMNAIIWVRQGKTQLALANISGAMMIQATVPSGLGLLFTDWRLDHALLWSGAITVAAITYLLVTMRANKLTPTRLAMAALLYLIFAAGLIPILI
ncbi:sodium:calcium antiporter [Mycobacterium sp.]|uniref:sodium:calcium antiporter n=1 Tax=Mycobacterium sp. TaxID=1785 RepID=UPI002CB3B415|nr:sodium:calcium antiporter [Mycobacterium sp.]HXB89417.1 sodium:calcium antiporter [Mycobacterium sp.]